MGKLSKKKTKRKLGQLRDTDNSGLRDRIQESFYRWHILVQSALRDLASPHIVLLVLVLLFILVATALRVMFVFGVQRLVAERNAHKH